MVLLEALAFGKPVVANDCPTGPREIPGDGRFGMLFLVGAIDALANAMRRIFTDDALHARMKARARNTALRRATGDGRALKAGVC